MKKLSRAYRHKRISRKVQGTAERPRLVVFRSSKHIYTQLVDDQNQKVIAGISTLSENFKKQNEKSANKESAKQLGKLIAKVAKSKKINVVRFDRGGYKFHGRVKSLADGAKEGGLKF